MRASVRQQAVVASSAEPAVGLANAVDTRAGVRERARRVNQRSAPSRGNGDRVQTLKPSRNVPCMIFKVPQKSISMLQLLNHLFYTRDGMLGC